ncbi:MAG: Gfo/Idh/MocA family oxidoreductase [Planctomycetota bacterium]
MSDSSTSRRDFLKASAAVTAAAMVVPGQLFASGSDALRVGLIGCGGRGNGAAHDCISSAPGVTLTALGDVFKDRLDASAEHLEGLLEDRFDVPAERRFTGFDAYQQVLATDVDIVILATPPGFRPIHLAAAIAAGKHVFMEKPAAVDPTGVRSVLESSQLAAKRGLAIVAGTQRRHEKRYRETIQCIHDGAIGDLVAAQCYWNQGGLWVHGRRPEYSDMEWQLRNWLYFTWASGDHIVEQHVHNIDVINWAFRTHPVKATAMGGRQVRTAPQYGNIFDHFAVEFEYPGGVLVQSMCRQIDGTSSRVSERLVGTKGVSNARDRIRGEVDYHFSERDVPNPYVQEHTDLITSIRAGTPLNEGRQIAESTLCAVMGRMSAYTGKEVTWDFAMQSKLDLVPKTFAFDELAIDAVAVPGQTPLI